MMNVNKKWFARISLLFIFVLLSFGVWYFYRSPLSSGPIYEFNEQRDTQDILEVFERDRYWLLASEDYSPELMLAYRMPKMKDWRYVGKLHIKVLREHEQFIGFVAYYMKTVHEGLVLFISVNPAFRNQGYARKLLEYAVEDLKRIGARYVYLLTRTSNVQAIRLYDRVGFTEIFRDDGFVYFKKQLMP